ncbi:MAG: hypothetical protein ABR499_14695 [Gemmatimonadaceae bacterium]
MSRATRLARWVGLGLVAGAVLQGEVGAQDTTRARRDTARVRRDTTVRVPIPPQADTIVKRDSIAQRDSAVRARLARLAADTVKAALARSQMPEPVDVARPMMRWDRAALFATGALTLLDLLERVPGLTALRAGWLAAPMVGAYLGNPAAVRVFYDGMEVDPLDPRMGGMLDLGSIQLWTAEEVSVERGADEIRVHVRSWRAHRTTPYTRADVGTGDQETNLYRGYFGRRFQRGEALQLSAQQFSTTPARLGGSSNHAAVHARVGWAKGLWSVDATVLRASPDRGTILTPLFGTASGEPAQDTIVPVAATETLGYFRAAYGDPEAGPWAQLLVGGQEYRFTGRAAATTDPNEPPPDPDTTRYQAQYTLTGGLTWRGLRLTATERVRALDGRRQHSPAVRASFASRLATVSLLAELRGADADPYAEASVRLAPLSFVAVGGAVATRAPRNASSEPAPTTARLEGAVRVSQLWLGGGVIRRPAVALAAPTIFSRRYVPVTGGEVTGAFATIRGRLWGPFYADVYGIQWEDAAGGGFYRPRYQTRSELYVSTTLPRRFPSGNFGLLASVLHEYRSHAFFPVEGVADRVGGYRVLSGLIEVRILQAVLTYQYRNLLIEDYSTVPNYLMPRQSQFYGVRWDFWN